MSMAAGIMKQALVKAFWNDTAEGRSCFIWNQATLPNS